MSVFDDVLKIEAPSHYTLSEALDFSVHSALGAGANCFIVKINNLPDVDILFDCAQMEELSANPEKYTREYKRSHFVAEMSGHFGCSGHYSSFGVMPFVSPMLEKALDTPVSSLSAQTLKDSFLQIEMEYCDHLFVSLQKAVQVGDSAVIKEGLSAIYWSVIDYIPNSRKHLTDDRRQALIEAASVVGVLTPDLQRVYETAGKGPSSWDLIAAAQPSANKGNKGPQA